jgi:MFS family permease
MDMRGFADEMTAMSTIQVSPSRPVVTGTLARVFAVQSISSITAVLLGSGIFFYTHKRFGWGPAQNLLLCGAQGVVYIVGALLASPISARIGRHKLLRCLHAALCPTALLVGLSINPAMAVGCLLLYSILSAAQWPALESLVSLGASAGQLSRRISLYNVIWSGLGALTLAATGTLIEYLPRGTFALAGLGSAVSVLLLWGRSDPPGVPAAAVEAEPQLLHRRKLAMQLSRLALPATYAAQNALSALMPTLAVIRQFPLQLRTIVASVWMIARWVTFLLLGMTAWWHTRPRMLLVAAVAQLFAFLAIVLIPSPLQMILWQMLLGAAVGLIYAGSLYFGMVLSDGSTEHGGYHEALIGLGSVIGPGSGALALLLRPDNPTIGPATIGVVLLLSVFAAALVSVRSPVRSGGS